jgi:O-methyltransferase domain
MQAANLFIIQKKPATKLASLTDLNMLVMLTGRERTLAEYSGLLKDAGLRFSKSTPIRWQMAGIEAEAP